MKNIFSDEVQYHPAKLALRIYNENILTVKSFFI